jgi:hypothetical protein
MSDKLTVIKHNYGPKFSRLFVSRRGRDIGIGLDPQAKVYPDEQAVKVFITSAEPVEPPKLIDQAPKGFLVDLLVPADRAEDMLLVLQKAYEERWVPKYGTRRARRILMMHSIGSVIGFWVNWMVKHLSLLKFFASGRG